MTTRPNFGSESDRGEPATEPGHDAFVRAKVYRGLEQRRDRASIIYIDRLWRACAL